MILIFNGNHHFYNQQNNLVYRVAFFHIETLISLIIEVETDTVATASTMFVSMMSAHGS